MFADVHSYYLRALFVAGLLVATSLSTSSVSPQYPPKNARSADPRLWGPRLFLRPMNMPLALHLC